MEEMTLGERRKYLARMVPRYMAADRAERGRLLDEMEQVTELHRKSLVRVLRPGGLHRRPRTRQRGRVYGAEVDDALRVIWESLDFICAERLTPALVTTARQLAVHRELVLGPELEGQLGSISRASVQRRLDRLSRDTPRLPRKGPHQANQLARRIPMRRIPWDEAEPGHFEVDLVHHSGPSAHGSYIHSLQLAGVNSGWSERVAVLGRGQQAMHGGFERVQHRLPFAIRELHPDNGSEFLNDHMVRFWGDTIPGLRLSRSRPYQKNDNRIVEQKNDSLVRAYFGKERLDTEVQCTLMNELYDDLWLYYNCFQPVLRLKDKLFKDNRVSRKWDDARTPLDRLLAIPEALSEIQCERLLTLRAATNPRLLRRTIYDKLERLWQTYDQAQAA